MIPPRIFPLLFTAFLIVIGLSEGCEKEPSTLGRDKIPDSISVFYDTSEVIHTYSRPGDSVLTNKKAILLLGEIADPVFGIAHAELLTQYTLQVRGAHDFGTDPQPDSVVLEMDFYDYRGDPFSQVEISVYEFESEIRSDSNWYSNRDVSDKFNPVVLGKGVINFPDSILKIYITEPNYINKFFTAADTIFADNSYFLEEFRGLYLIPEIISGEGAIIYMNYNNIPGSLTIHYHNQEDDSLSYSFIFGSLSREFNLYNHDFSGYSIGNYLNNGVENDSLVFVQSLGGTYTVIRLPEISAWLDSSSIAINNADLIITPVDTAISGLSVKDYPDLLNLYMIGPDGKYAYVYDYLVSSSTFGGRYDPATNSYTYSLRVHLQAYLNDELENLDLILIPEKNSENVSRVLLYGGNFSGLEKMRMEIVYTKL